MTDNLIDLFFSFRGRIDRQAWWIGMAFIAVAAAVGVWLFNDDSFDESIHAVQGSLTMAAFLWLILCLFAATALSAKRINDAGWPHWSTYLAASAGAVVVCGWGTGYFLDLKSAGAEAYAFWGLALLVLPVMVACAVHPATETSD